MDLGSIVAAVTTGSGVTSLLIAIFIYSIVQVLDALLKKLRDGLSKQTKLKGVVKREEADKVIQGLLDGAMAVLGGDRIQVIEFTNSVKNIALVPFNYMTCTYESYAINKKSMSSICQNIPTSLYGIFLLRLAQSSYIILNSEKRDLKLPANTYDLLNHRLAIKSLYVPLNSPLSHKLIGYILFDSNDAGDFSDRALTMLRGLSNQIGTLLTLGEW